MAENSIIAWTDHTFNIAWGCKKVSEGCRHCYAELLAKRYGYDVWGHEVRKTFDEKHWKKPLSWNRIAMEKGKRIKVFCSSMCDVFEDNPTINRERLKLWNVIRLTPGLDWQLLTKRPENIQPNLPEDWKEGYENVWLGTTVENMAVAYRADILRSIPAVIRFISYEPALGTLDGLDLTGLHWILYGGESGPKFRPHDLQWARNMKAKCEAAGVAFFYKQSAAIRTEMGIYLDGELVRNYPKGYDHGKTRGQTPTERHQTHQRQPRQATFEPE